MPLTLKKLADSTVPGTVDLRIPGQEGTEKVNLVFRPGVLTGALEERLRAYGDRGEGWADLISKLIVSWDIEAEPGKPFPLDFTPGKPAKLGRDGTTIIEPALPASGRLLELPVWMLQGIVEGVKAELRPNPKSAETSGASSSPEAS